MNRPLWSRLRWGHILLCLGLLVGQAAALAHATQHELLASADRTPCEQCAMAHSLGTPPGVAVLNLRAPPDAVITPSAFRAPPPRRAERPHSRGPPTFA